jgi:hypothetical protein
LVERCFIADAHQRQVVVFGPPRELEDKSAITHFLASRQLIQTLAEYGHQSLVVLHHCFDRALAAPLFRLHHKFYWMLYVQVAETQDEGEAYLGWLTTWITGCGCYAHDCHGALRWAIFSFVADARVMRSCFITVESLRNAFSLLTRHLGGWLARVVRYANWEGVDLARTYTIFGVTEDWLPLMLDVQAR